MQFGQPDTQIPEPYNPQSWNRYSYALNNPVNNPVNNIDPSGHDATTKKYCDADGYCVGVPLGGSGSDGNGGGLSSSSAPTIPVDPTTGNGGSTVPQLPCSNLSGLVGAVYGTTC
jgi:uncharacterized protein RhaS with RHS repeats